MSSTKLAAFTELLPKRVDEVDLADLVRLELNALQVGFCPSGEVKDGNKNRDRQEEV